jgi:hypothetical protein
MRPVVRGSLGAIVAGIGMAVLELTVTEFKQGRPTPAAGVLVSGWGDAG